MSDKLKETILTQQKTDEASKASSGHDSTQELSDLILAVLDEHSAQDVIPIDLKGKSSVADTMIIASGRSKRHVGALADYVQRSLKENGHKTLGIEGDGPNDWILIDGGDVILHLFRPEVRAFYNLEKIWSLPLPESLQNLMSKEDILADL